MTDRNEGSCTALKDTEAERRSDERRDNGDFSYPIKKNAHLDRMMKKSEKMKADGQLTESKQLDGWRVGLRSRREMK